MREEGPNHRNHPPLGRPTDHPAPLGRWRLHRWSPPALARLDVEAGLSAGSHRVCSRPATLLPLRHSTYHGQQGPHRYPNRAPPDCCPSAPKRARLMAQLVVVGLDDGLLRDPTTPVTTSEQEPVVALLGSQARARRMAPCSPPAVAGPSNPPADHLSCFCCLCRPYLDLLPYLSRWAASKSSAGQQASTPSLTQNWHSGSLQNSSLMCYRSMPVCGPSLQCLHCHRYLPRRWPQASPTNPTQLAPDKTL
mmetsp:Transcript_21981/g.48198  ORF Transcript_21981/g.48198 Transcript_21981/m.48198 type:complete len:250 (-) Transcript_21981:311-1060(-)